MKEAYLKAVAPWAGVPSRTHASTHVFPKCSSNSDNELAIFPWTHYHSYHHDCSAAISFSLQVRAKAAQSWLTQAVWCCWQRIAVLNGLTLSPVTAPWCANGVSLPLFNLKREKNIAVFFGETSCSIFFVTHSLFEGRICDGHREHNRAEQHSSVENEWNYFHCVSSCSSYACVTPTMSQQNLWIYNEVLCLERHTYLVWHLLACGRKRKSHWLLCQINQQLFSLA